MRITARDLAKFAAFTAIALCSAVHWAMAADQTPFNSIAKLATALSENDPDGALQFFDSHMKNYADIEQRIEALTSQADISCAIDVVTDNESGDVHKLDLDWFMQLTDQTDSSQLERRRQRVQVEMRRFKNTWKITEFSPITVLDPIHLR